VCYLSTFDAVSDTLHGAAIDSREKDMGRNLKLDLWILDNRGGNRFRNGWGFLFAVMSRHHELLNVEEFVNLGRESVSGSWKRTNCALIVAVEPT
jgi:hypothetical protein